VAILIYDIEKIIVGKELGTKQMIGGFSCRIAFMFEIFTSKNRKNFSDIYQGSSLFCCNFVKLANLNEQIHRTLPNIPLIDGNKINDQEY